MHDHGLDGWSTHELFTLWFCFWNDEEVFEERTGHKKANKKEASIDP